MSKTNLQIQNFLVSNSYRSEADWEMISAFCQQKTDFNVNAEIDPQTGISASEFIEWYENGFGAGDVVSDGSEVYILGTSHFKAVSAIGKVSDEQVIILDTEMPVEGLKMAEEGIQLKVRDLMFSQGLQFSWKEMKLIEKYMPSVNERVIFHGKGVKGLGVVRDVDYKTGEVELYCYYIYETRQCGYNMHEKGIVNLQDFWFEPMDNGDKRQSKMNGIACQRRLNRELGKFGKVWNERLHRVEPVEIQAEVGKTYWYITDKMTLTQDVEKGLQASRTRANAGNYFLKREDGLEILTKWVEDLRERLAK